MEKRSSSFAMKSCAQLYCPLAGLVAPLMAEVTFGPSFFSARAAMRASRALSASSNCLANSMAAGLCARMVFPYLNSTKAGVSGSDDVVKWRFWERCGRVCIRVSHK